MSNSKSPLSYGVPVGAAIIAFEDGEGGGGRYNTMMVWPAVCEITVSIFNHEK